MFKTIKKRTVIFFYVFTKNCLHLQKKNVLNQMKKIYLCRKFICELQIVCGIYSVENIVFKQYALWCHNIIITICANVE